MTTQMHDAGGGTCCHDASGAVQLGAPLGAEAAIAAGLAGDSGAPGLPGAPGLSGALPGGGQQAPEACCGGHPATGVGHHGANGAQPGPVPEGQAGARPATVVGQQERLSQDALEAIAATVNDPEIPVLSIKDLGILRGVRQDEHGVVVTITPTYSGCPAMDTIADDLRIAFQEAGLPGARVELTLTPAWTTDWMSQDGKAKLEKYGIAPPSPRRDGDRLRLSLTVKCPRCHSLDTRELSRFGSTSCKALYQCNACQEPFDFFKAL